MINMELNSSSDSIGMKNPNEILFFWALLKKTPIFTQEKIKNQAAHGSESTFKPESWLC